MLTPRFIAPLAILGLQGLPTRAEAQAPIPPVVAWRQIAAVGPEQGLFYQGPWVAETHLAVSNAHVFVVFRKNSTSGMQGYAVFDKQLETWTSDPLGEDLRVYGATDPAVAYDTANNRFLIAELLTQNIKVTRYNPNTDTLKVPKNGIHEEDGGLDKPWIVRGQNDVNRQEFYVTAFRNPPARYGRSLDGGVTWENEEDMPVISTFSIEPSVALPTPTSPLYLVYTLAGIADYYFLQGDDNGTLVDFSHLTDSLGAPIFVSPLRNCGNCTLIAPGPFPVKPSPHLAADPTNPDRLYLVYFDLAPGSADDLDVLCVRLDHIGGMAGWSVGTPVRVNDDVNDPDVHTDQILPDLAVDDAGRVHVVFYDDRNYDQLDTETEAKYDVYYAYSLDAGQTFTNVKLVANPDQTALDHSLVVDSKVPLEYPGIATFANEVWVSFAGTYDQDTTDDKSVIYVTKITFGN